MRLDVGPDLEDGAHDLFERARTESSTGRRPVGVDNRANRTEIGRDHPVEARVQGDVRELHLGTGDNAGEGPAEPGVEHRRDRGVRAAEVVVACIARDGHLHGDRDQAFLLTGVLIDVILGVPDAVGQGADLGARQILDIVLDFGHGGLDRLDTVFVTETLDLPLGYAGGFGLRLHVADDVARIAGVLGDEIRDVFEELVLAPQASRRNPQALTHVIECLDVERTRSRATDVGPVSVRLCVAEQFTLVVDRPDDPGVVEVTATFIDVVDDKYVAGVDVAVELPDDGFGRVVQGADVCGDVAGALHDGVPVGVTECRRKVARVDDKRVAGAEDLLGHLVDGVDEGVLEYFECHWIE